MILLVDAEGVVRRAFVGTVSATDLWAAMADLRLTRERSRSGTGRPRGLRVRCRSASVPARSTPLSAPGADFGDRAVGVADLAEATGLAAHRVVDEAADFGAVDRLVFEERQRHGVETERGAPR